MKEIYIDAVRGTMVHVQFIWSREEVAHGWFNLVGPDMQVLSDTVHAWVTDKLSSGNLCQFISDRP